MPQDNSFLLPSHNIYKARLVGTSKTSPKTSPYPLTSVAPVSKDKTSSLLYTSPFFFIICLCRCPGRNSDINNTPTVHKISNQVCVPLDVIQGLRIASKTAVPYLVVLSEANSLASSENYRSAVANIGCVHHYLISISLK